MTRNRYAPAQRRFYSLYLQSAEWRQKRLWRIRKAGGCCEYRPEKGGPRCTRRRFLCVHHNTYDRLGRELDTDLDVLCWAHHMVEHLLWKKCTFCKRPCLLTDVAAEIWLNAALSNLGIDLDTGPSNWRRLPTKEYFLAEIPYLCRECRPSVGKCDENDDKASR